MELASINWDFWKKLMEFPCELDDRPRTAGGMRATVLKALF
jgi:hypothetical protein